MCGIAGYVTRKRTPPEVLGRMLTAIRHRGPDGSGEFHEGECALGSNLLAIVDVGRGKQPFYRSFGQEDYAGVFNGELYNYRDLRSDLAAKGLRFETDCDTEVALAAYACWGEDAILRFEGQWALAVWARGAKRLFLSRDPFGIKPLFYHASAGLLAFASEPKALFANPDIPKRPNIEAIQDYFLHGFAFAAGYSLNHESFYQDVRAVPPGHSLVWRSGSEISLRPWFDYPLGEELRGEDLATASDELAGRLSSSIVASMMGDAPIGVALSGGVDSSVITAVAAKQHHASHDSPLLVSCIRYRGQAANEDASHASLLAQFLGPEAPLRLVFSEMDAASYLDDVDLMISHFDEPHWEVKQLAMFNNYRKLKSEGAKVVLTGEGADELFFGYFHRFPGFKAPSIGSPGELHHHWSSRIPVVQGLLADGNRSGLSERMDLAIERFYRPYIEKGVGEARAMQCWYFATFLNWLLIDNDRCSMAFSLEGRFPFLNRRVFEFALRLPADAQLGGDLGEEKLLLRQGFRNVLPEEIWRHRKKAPLPSPMLLDFHSHLRDGFAVAMDDCPAEFWDVVSRQGARTLLSDYDAAIHGLRVGGQIANGGEILTRYLRLDEEWSVRSPQIFGLLTLLRWWRINFS